MTECADDSDGVDIENGHYVTCKTLKYIVMEKIGQGGYGAVYRVQPDPSDGKQYAMKVEQKLEKREHSKLSMELHLLKLMSNQPKSYHFTKVVNRAKKVNFFFIIMTLVGESLAELKRRNTPTVFSLATSLGISIQCLEAIEELHKVGFVHRDIKPGNFAIGLPPNTHTIYILDFGIARKFTNNSGDVKGPRCKVPFKGTVRYAALACHRNRELGPKDDCESWMYMIVDCTNPKGVSWKMDKDRKKVEEKKMEARTPNGQKRMFENMGVKDMSDIMEYIDKLDYQDKIRKAALAMKVRIDDPYDWEMQGDDEEDGTTQKTRTLSSYGTAEKKDTTDKKETTDKKGTPDKKEKSGTSSKTTRTSKSKNTPEKKAGTPR